MPKGHPNPKPEAEKNAAELEQDRHDAMAAQIGEPDPPRQPAEPKEDKRTAIQQERDQQKAVEKALHGITLVDQDG